MTSKEFFSLYRTIKDLPVVNSYSFGVNILDFSKERSCYSVYHEGELYLINKHRAEYVSLYKGYEINADHGLLEHIDEDNLLGILTLGDGKYFVVHSESSYSAINHDLKKITRLYYYIHGKRLSKEQFEVHKNKASLKEKIKSI